MNELLLGNKKVYDSIDRYDYSYTKHTIITKDKTPLNAIFIKTPKTSKGLVLVVNGMHLNMSERFTKWLWLVDEGCDIFTFDFRGYGESDEKADIYKLNDDVDSAITYLHNLEKDRKIVAVGQSMGGTLLIDTLSAKKYDYISLAVIDSTFTGFASNLSALMAKTVILLPVCWLPYTFSPNDLDSIKHVQHVQTPLLFVSGNSDYITSYKNSKELYEKATTKKAIWIVEDAGHVESFDNKDVRSAFLDLLGNIEKLKVDKQKHFKSNEIKI